MSQLLDTLKAMDLHKAQERAVADHLLRYGEINRDFAYDVGLKACGRIKNLGGRIHDLRKDGWQIKTDVRNGVCFYVLIAAPGQQMALV
jgi:hypothetical protein